MQIVWQMGKSLLLDSVNSFSYMAFHNFIIVYLSSYPKWGILSLQSVFLVQSDKVGESLGPATRNKSIWGRGDLLV